MKQGSINKSLNKTAKIGEKISKALVDFNRTGKTREERTLGRKKSK